jgi:trk system potassium uptake protein TrkH
VWSDRPDGVFASVFHSISAFCNAGFSLEKTSMVQLRDRWQILSVMPMLVILGGLGFPVLYDLMIKLPRMARFMRRRHWRNPGMERPRLTLQTKVVLITTGLLLVIGTGVLLLVEPAPGIPAAQLEKDRSASPVEQAARLTDWQKVDGVSRVGQAWFQSMTARTAGFNTINIDELSSAGKLWMILLMLIGGSPASTAGGMKTVTFTVLLMLVWSILSRRQNVEIMRRTVADELVRRAIVVAGLFLGLVFLVTLLLCIAQPASRFMDVLFESVSACGTVGLSTGETARLTLMGKYVITAAMFVGRVGPLTLLAGMVIRETTGRYAYPTENLVMG